MTCLVCWQAACMLVDLGIDPYTIDKAIQFGFGMPMGPFRCVTPLSGGCLSLSFLGIKHETCDSCSAVR